MENKTQNTKVEVQKVEASTPKVAKVMPTTLSSVVLECLLKGAKDKEAIFKNVQNACKLRKITKNMRGNEITDARINSMRNNILRDIFQQRKGWYAKYEIVESTTELRIKLRVLNVPKN